MSNRMKVRITFPWASMLFVIFLILKLTGTITWSWWWVTAPLWIPVGFLFAIMIFIAIASFIIVALDR